MFWHELTMIVLGVLCGSVLFGCFLPMKLKGMDVTELSDDHNPGTANAMKYAGVTVGILCLAGDLFKGILPIHMAVRLGLPAGPLFPLVMAAPVFGHAYSLFHRGKGGKAIAVSFGVLLGLLPVQTDLLVLLCALYLVFSLVIIIRPHTKRTRVTFGLFGCGAVGLLCMERIPPGMCMGALLIAGIVLHKNRLSREDGLKETETSLPEERQTI